MTTYVEKPFLNRTAMVNVIDYDIRMRDSVRWEGKFLASQINSPMEDSHGYGFYTNLTYNPSEHWNYVITLTSYDDTLDINDMGYMRRNNLEEMFMSGEWVQTGFSEKFPLASLSWDLRAVIAQNTDGDNFPRNFSLGSRAKLRTGSDILLDIELQTKGYDDLMSRGNGLVRLNKRWEAELSYMAPRRGAWANHIELMAFQEGYNDWSAGIEASATLYYKNNLNIDFRVNPSWSRDWLIWLKGNQLASFSKTQITGGIGAAWFPAEGHELRLRTQWYVINAVGEQEYRIGQGGRLFESNDPVKGFAVINFGMQMRYRYEIAPLSDLYLVYSRGGLDRIDEPEQNTMELLSESSSLRNSDQFLVKARCRF
jgi:hypothetical protein